MERAHRVTGEPAIIMSSDAARELLLRQAEAQMRRNFQHDDERDAKRQKTSEEYVEVGRFDYSAVGELDSGAAGFLITCNFRNEKTATKEANQVLVTYLQRHMPSAAAPEAPPALAATKEGSDDAAPAAESQSPCKPLLSIVKLGCRGVVLLKLTAAATKLAAQQPQPQQLQAAAASGAAEKKDGEQQGQQGPSAALPGSLAAAQLVQKVAIELLADVEGGKRKRLLHCQRIVPIATTCSLGTQQMQQAGRRLAELTVAAPAAAPAPAAGQQQAGEEGKDVVEDGQPKQQQQQQRQRQLSFGVAFKARCCSESGSRVTGAPKASGAAAEQQAQQPGAEASAAAAADEGQGPAAAPAVAGGEGALGRTDIIKAVAAGFEAVLRDGHGLEVKVDLKSPDWVVHVEELPVMGSAYLALAALPGGLCNIKNKMQMRQVGALSTRNQGT